MKVPFYKPDITEGDIQAVAAVLRSGWITTGPVTASFEQALAEYTGASYAVCFSSATTGMEMVLREFGVTSGDRVITTPYTYAATINSILHCGAEPVLVDLLPGTWEMDPESVARILDDRVKAVLPVDFAGWPCDHDRLLEALSSACFVPATRMQEALGRPLLLCDAAHSFGSRYHGKRLPDAVDVAVYSFHAVKNLTTAEGGAALFLEQPDCFTDATARSLKARALHGQDKDGLAKSRDGGWEYDIVEPGFKCNMADIQAAIGLSQLKRYDASLSRRKLIAKRYSAGFFGEPRLLLPPFEAADRECAWHIYPLRIRDASAEHRNRFISRQMESGVSCNVHFKPVPLFSAYSGMFDIGDYPNALAMYCNEVSLPLFPTMTDSEVAHVVESVLAAVARIPG